MVLHAGRRLHAARDIDGVRPGGADRLADVLGRQAAGQHDGPAPRDRAGLRPVNRLSRAAPPLGIGGIVAFIMGSLMMIDTDVPGFILPWPLIAAIALVSVLFILLVLGMAIQARKRPVVSGHEEMLGAGGEVIEDFSNEGWARIHSETWKIRSAIPLRRGQKVRVTSIDGLALEVVPDGPAKEGE